MSTAKVYDINAERQLRSNRMENQKHGYIPLYRSVKKQPWAKDVFLRTLWENLLIDAARQPYTADYKGHRWQLDIGQLVTTSADLGLALCDRNGEPTSRHAVERMLAFFEKEEMIFVRAERRKGTLITILNYAEYAEKMSATPAHNSAHNSAHSEPSSDAASEPTPAHMGAHRSAHHEQEGNNKNKTFSSSRNSDESPDEHTKRFLSRHPEAADGAYTPSGKSWGTAEDLKAARWIHDKIIMVDATASEPNWPEWANTVRLMRQQDGRSHYDICELFKWANKHHFWSANILSPTALRKHWGALTAQRKSDKGTGNRQALDFNNTDWAEGLQI